MIVVNYTYVYSSFDPTWYLYECDSYFYFHGKILVVFYLQKQSFFPIHNIYNGERELKWKGNGNQIHKLPKIFSPNTD